ncbi:MAG: hypothetical protein V1766_09925 [Pseudomonadota bacterium]
MGIDHRKKTVACQSWNTELSLVAFLYILPACSGLSGHSVLPIIESVEKVFAPCNPKFLVLYFHIILFFIPPDGSNITDQPH